MHTDTDFSKAPEGVISQPRQARGWLQWLFPRPFYLISSAIYLCVFGGFLYTFATVLFQSQACGCQPEWVRLLLMTCAIAALFALDRLEYRLYGEETPRRAAIVLLLARVLVYEVVAATDYYQYSPMLTLFLPLLGTWYFGSLVGSGLAVLAYVDYAIHQAVNTPGYLSNPATTGFNLLFVIALVFTLALGHVLVREKASRTRSEQLLAELGEAHRQLRLYQEADQAVRDAKRLASEALQDVRRSVSTLRAMEERFTFIPAITELVERVQSSQLELSFQMKGSEEGYSRQALLSLFRAAQEGLTNIQKYAAASSAQLELEFGEAVATVCLTDNGRGFEPEMLADLPPGRQGSYGLQGVRERLELIGGSLQIRSSPGEGTCLCATVPRAQPGVAGASLAETVEGGKA